MTAQTSTFRVNRDINKSLQKLSTGLRINTAADDAAGLGVSENLRSQVKGMQMAFRNTQDAISLLQIADGALNEQADILQRMREIVIQAKNDTYTQNERDYMYQEFSGLMGELDRIAAVTNYNGMNIFAAPEGQTGVNGQTLLPLNNYAGSPHAAIDARDIWDDASDSVFGAEDYSSAYHFNMMLGANYSQTDIDSYNAATESFDKSAQNLVTIQFGQMDANALLSKDPSVPMGNASLVFDDFRWDSTAFVNDREEFWLSIAYEGAPARGTVQTKLDFLLDLINGSDEDIPTIGFMRSNNGSSGVTHNATGLQRVNQMRANIGAMVNRLEHSSNNLLNQISNTQSAESLIRDADFANESAQFTKNQILSQSSTAMLAQSNALPQSVLQLLG
jgi:flagellin